MNTRARTKSHTMKSPLKHEKLQIVKSPSQMEKKEKIEKQGASRLMEAERATTNKRRSSRERKMALLQDVDKLKKKLSHEESVHRALERAFNRPLGVLPRLPPYLPPSTLELLAEVAVLEEEVVRLEEQVVNYRKGLYEEAIYISSSKRNKENLSHVCNSQCKYLIKEQPNYLYQIDGRSVVHMVSLNRLISKTNVDQIGNCSNRLTFKINVDQIRNCSNRYTNGRQFLKKPDSSSSLSENVRGKVSQPCIESTKNKQTPNGQRSRIPLKRASMEHKAMENLLEPLKHELECRILDQKIVKQNCLDISGEGPFQGETSSPNKTSEDLVKCLTSIFLRMVMNHGEDVKETDHQDPYGIYKEFKKREIGPYKDMYAIEANSIDTNLKATSWFLIQRLKVLLGKLASLGLQGLTHQQKLAFWINIYNSCMMNAFLEHGIPESPQMVVALMQKAMINVGGQLLNAMTIEHFILRLPYNFKDIYLKDAKSNEIKARSIIGLEWSEPLVTFALSCGCWSSPAVRVYTASSIENELEAAKKDYLQAAITISTDDKLVIPKLLDWYLLDFAKDLQSFLDWICLQLPNDLRNEAISCLARGRKELLRQSVQVVPYEFSFRYLFHI